MRTQEMLNGLPEKNRKYLETLKEDIKKLKAMNQNKVADDYKATGKGYIKGLVDCGVVDDFKTVWCWFTL